MEEAKQHNGNLFLRYLTLVVSLLIWAGAWSFPIVATEWASLANCASGLCGTVTAVYGSLLFKGLVIGVLVLLVAKEFLVSEHSTKLKLNLAFLLLGVVVTALFIAGLSVPLLSAEPV